MPSSCPYSSSVSNRSIMMINRSSIDSNRRSSPSMIVYSLSSFIILLLYVLAFFSADPSFLHRDAPLSSFFVVSNEIVSDENACNRLKSILPISSPPKTPPSSDSSIPPLPTITDRSQMYEIAASCIKESDPSWTVLSFAKYLRRVGEYRSAEEVVDRFFDAQSSALSFFALDAIITEVIRHTAALHQIGESGRAERWLRKSIEATDEKQRRLTETGQWTAAASVLSHHTRLRMELVTCLLMQGRERHSEAIDLLRSLIAADPEHIPALYYLLRLTKKNTETTRSLVSHYERLRWTLPPSPLCYFENAHDVEESATDMNWRDWSFRPSPLSSNGIPIHRYSGFIPNESWTVPRLSYSAVDDQFDQFVRTRQPFIIESGVFSSLEWRVDRWASDYLKKTAGDEQVWVEKRVDGMPFGFEPLKIRTNFSSFIDQLDDESSSISNWYLNTQGTSELVDPPLRRLTDDLTIPGWLEGRRLKSVNMWMGRASESGGTSNLHHDDDDNLYALIEGRKEIILYSPADAFYLYPVGRIAQIFSNGYTVYAEQPSRWGKDWYSDNFSLVPPDHINNNRTDLWPLLRYTRPYKITLYPGEMLFIPSGWWHQVSSFGRNLAINFWWMPPLQQPSS